MDAATWSWVLGSAATSAAGAWLLPAYIRRLPERDPDAPAGYAAIAASRSLPGLLAAAAAVVGALLGWGRAGQPDLPAFLALGVLGTGMAYVDLRCHLLPDRLTVPALVAGAVLLAAAAPASQDGGTSYARAWAAAGALLLFYLLLALIYPAGLGLGDVKLAATLGLHLGWLSWSAAVVGTLAAFFIGGLVGLALLLARRATRGTAIPFGPSMLLGALVAVVWAEPIVAWYLR
jgi:leader peptidase (prepilin peptidase)/N-methyltransferase